jgi:hypothetical protein
VVGRMFPSNSTVIDALPLLCLDSPTTTPVRALILGLRDAPNSVILTRSPNSNLIRDIVLSSCTVRVES